MKHMLCKWLSALLVAVLLVSPLALAEEAEPEIVEIAEDSAQAEETATQEEAPAEEEPQTTEPVDDEPQAVEPVEEVPAESAELELVESSEFEVELVEDDGAEMSYEPEKYMSSGDIAIDASHFPDSAFRSYISQNFDRDGNGKLSAQEIESAQQMDLGRINGRSGDANS